MRFRTRYGQPILRVLNAYPPQSPQLAMALETLVITAMNNTQGESRDNIALAVCQQLHAGPPKGVACASCFEALEQNKVVLSEDDQMQVPEIASSKAELDSIERTVQNFVNNSAEPAAEVDNFEYDDSE